MICEARARRGLGRWPLIAVIVAVAGLVFGAPACMADALAGPDAMLGAIAAGPLASPFGRMSRDPEAAARVAAGRLDALPLAFEANQGQVDGAARFVARGASHSLALASTGAVLRLGGSRALRMRFLGANPRPAVVGEQRLATTTNVFVGDDPAKWRRSVPTFGRVRYRDLWEGIDALFYGNGRRLEYDFVVAPGADVGAIRMGLRGARTARIDARGDLLLNVGGRTVRQLRPIAYQDVDGHRVSVASEYVLGRAGRLGVRVGSYDTTRRLVIDPVVAYSTTAIDGNTEDFGFGVAVDTAGAAYITGYTMSTDLGTPSSPQPVYMGQNEAFAAKLNPAGTALEYITYLGGASQDVGYDIAVDNDGNAYVAGGTASLDFPTSHPFQPSKIGGYYNGFVTKLDADGGALVYSTYLGGDGGASILGIALDASRNAYVTGHAGPGFPRAAGAPGGSLDAFAAKLDAGGSDLLYSTYLQGTRQAAAIAVDGADAAYVVGFTSEAGLATAGALQTTGAGDDDAFVEKLDASGGRVYATYLGGAGADAADALAVDAAGAVYVVGSTRSTDFPTRSAIQPDHAYPEGANEDAFISKIAPAGDALVYSTYLGGTTFDAATGIALLPTGGAVVVGRTNSPDFPLANAFRPFLTGFSVIGFLAQLTPDGASLVSSSGTDVAYPYDVALDTSGYAYLLGGDGNGAVPLAKYPTDVEPPETAIVSGPPSTSTSTVATLSFSTTEPASAFECQLDGSAFATCTSPKTYSILADGSHTFRVRAIDEARNVDQSPASYTWIVAADPPQTTIVGTPPSVTNATAMFAFASDRAGSTFACRIDQAAFAPCASPKAYGGLSAGAHTFRVRATDPAGETDVSPAEVTWNVDLTPPDTFIASSPLLTSADTTAVFEFASTDGAATLDCRLDDESFAPCASPRSYAALTDGPHTFRVRSTDAVGNADPTPASYTWTVETTRPDTTITLRPPPASAGSHATFGFTASEPATFECALDNEGFSACSSPTTLTGLTEGEHAFAVRAVDAADKRDLTPATATWTVDLTPPEPFAASQPAADAQSLSTSPAFAWAATADALTGLDRYELWLDGRLERTFAAAACTSGCVTTPDAALADGPHTWLVRAFDVAGNDRATASRGFTVDAAPPAPFGLTEPQDGAATASPRLALSWQSAPDAGSGTAAYEVLIDGRVAGETAAPSTSFTPPGALAEGTHTWQVVARDANGNRRPTREQRFVVDVTRPSASFTAAPNPALAGRSVTFDATASTDAGSGIVRFEWDLDGDGTFERDSGAISSTQQIYPDPGIYAVALRVTDRAGLSTSFRSDQRIAAGTRTSAPLGISINDRAKYTNDTRVRLKLTSPGFATQVLISNDGGFQPATTFAVMGVIPWTLDSTGADRLPTFVYARYIRGSTVSETYFDNIVLDEHAPVVTSARLAPSKGRGTPLLALRTHDRGHSGVVGVQVTNDRARPDARYRAYHATIRLTRQRGERRLSVRRAVYVRVRDRAGNVSRWHAMSVARRR